MLLMFLLTLSALALPFSVLGRLSVILYSLFAKLSPKNKSKLPCLLQLQGGNCPPYPPPSDVGPDKNTRLKTVHTDTNETIVEVDIQMEAAEKRNCQRRLVPNDIIIIIEDIASDPE